MSWETIERQPFGGGNNGAVKYGEAWNEQPAIAITKNGLAFNQAFMGTFVNGHRAIKVLIDREQGRLGLRPLSTDEDKTAFTITRKTGKQASALHNARIAKSLETHQGKAYRAKYNAIDNVVEVALTPANQL